MRIFYFSDIFETSQLPYALVASLNGVAMFGQAHDVSLVSAVAKEQDCRILWRDYHNSIRLILASPNDSPSEVHLHRLLDQLERLQQARVIVVVAGMEAALASVVSGLVSAPVIAVPTSVGYGASFEGLAALLGMVNSCAPGVGVVNIDNGFGAGYLAAQICLMPNTGAD